MEQNFQKYLINGEFFNGSRDDGFEFEGKLVEFNDGRVFGYRRDYDSLLGKKEFPGCYSALVGLRRSGELNLISSVNPIYNSNFPIRLISFDVGDFQLPLSGKYIGKNSSIGFVRPEILLQDTPEISKSFNKGALSKPNIEKLMEIGLNRRVFNAINPATVLNSRELGQRIVMNFSKQK